MNKEKIYAVSFNMWRDKYAHGLLGEKGQWLNYWEVYDIFLTHKKFDTYIKHAENMEPKNKSITT